MWVVVLLYNIWLKSVFYWETLKIKALFIYSFTYVLLYNVGPGSKRVRVTKDLLSINLWNISIIMLSYIKVF